MKPIPELHRLNVGNHCAWPRSSGKKMGKVPVKVKVPMKVEHATDKHEDKNQDKKDQAKDEDEDKAREKVGAKRLATFKKLRTRLFQSKGPHFLHIKKIEFGILRKHPRSCYEDVRKEARADIQEADVLFLKLR